MTQRVGIPYVISAPSGAGKTSLVAALLQSRTELQLSISYTTRPQRANEHQAKNYHFIDKPRFEAMIAAGEFLEYAQVYGYYYGTSKTWLTQTLAAGKDVVLEIDWQGARSVKQALASSVAIFVLPPSTQTLEQRLCSRGQDDAAVIATRMSQSQQEMAHYREFDYVVVNDKFEQALNDLKAIVQVQRLRLEHQMIAQQELLSTLLAEFQ